MSPRSLKLKNYDTHTFLTLINLITIDALRESDEYLSNLILVSASKSESSYISESFKCFRNLVLIFFFYFLFLFMLILFDLHLLVGAPLLTFHNKSHKVPLNHSEWLLSTLPWDWEKTANLQVWEAGTVHLYEMGFGAVWSLLVLLFCGWSLISNSQHNHIQAGWCCSHL